MFAKFQQINIELCGNLSSSKYSIIQTKDLVVSIVNFEHISHLAIVFLFKLRPELLMNKSSHQSCYIKVNSYANQNKP